MARTSIPTLNLQDYFSEDEQRKSHFIKSLGDALSDIGFFALTGHGIDLQNIDNAYTVAKDFFSLPNDIKEKYEQIK
jgi:isopenicillin N synthase-like dioxygenase